MENEERDRIIREYNRKAKHQQDMVQGYWGGCRCIAAGTHGSTPHILKTIKKWKRRLSESDKQAMKEVKPVQ